MKLTIEIPKKYEKDFKDNKFNDCLGRVLSDVLDGFFCGKHEIDIIRMFMRAFVDADIVTEDDRKPFIVVKTVISPYERLTANIFEGKTEKECTDLLINELKMAVIDDDFDGVNDLDSSDLNLETFTSKEDDAINVIDEILENKNVTFHFMRSPSGIETEFYQILKL